MSNPVFDATALYLDTLGVFGQQGILGLTNSNCLVIPLFDDDEQITRHLFITSNDQEVIVSMYQGNIKHYETGDDIEICRVRDKKRLLILLDIILDM